MRLKAYEGQMVDTDSKTVTENDEEWCAPTYTNQSGTNRSAASTTTASSSSTSTTTSSVNTKADDREDSEEIPDMEDYDENNLGEADDPAALKASSKAAKVAAAPTTTAAAAAATATATAATSTAPAPAVENENIMRTRTYDISITYDKYYQTPKFWLFGYDEARQPLRAEQVFEDISADHAQRTVTIETHLHKNEAWAFIHPCRHAAVMKRIVERQLANGKTPRPDQYLFLFLKFISAICPCSKCLFARAAFLTMSLPS
jgi:ubiquitin-like-conjugating enzyme ATG3